MIVFIASGLSVREAAAVQAFEALAHRRHVKPVDDEAHVLVRAPFRRQRHGDDALGDDIAPASTPRWKPR